MTDTLPSASATRPDAVPGAPRSDASAAGGGRPSPGGGRRDAYFDNVKFFLILLVVVGHFWEVFRTDSHAAGAAYTVVYGFHMPVFVFVSGFFSRGFMRSPDKFRGTFPALVVPYVIFNVLYRLQLNFLEHHRSRVQSAGVSPPMSGFAP